MGLNFKKWLSEKLSKGTEKRSLVSVDWTEFFGLMDQVYIRELAFWTCVNKIANALSKCEFRTYYHHELVKKGEYYLWNIEPNRNQNASAFLTKLIGKLYLNNEALVVESSGQLYVADDFQKTVYALYDYQFTGVTVDDFTFGKTFHQNEVLYFQLNSLDMRQLVNLLYSSYNELLQYAANAYRKSRGSRGILDIDAQAQAEAKSFISDIRETKAALDAYDEPLMRETLSLLKQAVEGGQISVIEYFVEAANIYTNLSNCITLQNRYQKLLAQLYINRL